MHTIVRPLAILSLAGAMQWSTIGFAEAQNYAPTHPPTPGATPPSYSGPGWGPEEAPPATPETTTTEDLPVLYVTNVEILRASAEPELDIVRVTGLASTEGWSDPELVPTYAGKPFDGVLDLELIATPPEHSEDASGFVPVSAILPLEPGQQLKGVRVRGSGNAIAVKQIPGSGQAAVHVNDCASCVGKKFVAEGSSAQSQQDAVRQEDLPKLLRIIKASDGIRGNEHDPNRLTLILDDDNTILQAFWD
jgi:hypothetical protein